MAKTKSQKQEMLKKYGALLKQAKGLVVITPSGIGPNAVNTFREKLNPVGSDYHIVKNTLFKIALTEAGQPSLQTFDSGSHAVIFVQDDIVSTAKLLKDFVKLNADKVQVETGLLEGEVLSHEQVQGLADMPTKEQSISMIAGLINQSLAGVANVLEDSIRSVAIIINQAFEEK